MKTKINTENYGAYWIDYLDGILSSEQEETLFSFLEKNTEIAGDLIDVEDNQLPKFDVELPNKQNLLNQNQTELLLIAKLENEISEENEALIDKKINSNPKIAHSYSLYKKTIIVPNNEIVYPDKESLKRTVKVPLFSYFSSIAAAITIVFVAGYFLTRNLDTSIKGNIPLTSDISVIPLKTNNNNNTIDINIGETNNSNSNITSPIFNTNTNNQLADNSTNRQILSVPQKLPLNATKKVECKQVFSTSEIMEYRYDVPTDDVSFAYTMEYTKAPKDGRFMSGLKKAVKFGKEIDVKESWDNFKTAKEEFFYSSIEE